MATFTVMHKSNTGFDTVEEAEHYIKTHFSAGSQPVWRVVRVEELDTEGETVVHHTATKPLVGSASSLADRVLATDDEVERPAHYRQGDVECIDAIRAQLTPEEFRGYCKGNVAKYVWRERMKEGTKALKKARWYLNQLLNGGAQ